MSVVEKEAKALPYWKIEATKRLLDRGEFQYGEVTKFLKQTAEDLKVPFSQVSQFYYMEFKKRDELPYMKLVVENLNELNTKGSAPAPTPQPSKDEPKAPELTQEELERLVAADPEKFFVKDGEYKRGKVVEVRVTEIRDYGALVETTDGYHTRGLIHITQMRHNEYVPSVEKFLRFGDVTKATILEYDSVMDRMKLSTRFMPLKQYSVSSRYYSTTPVSGAQHEAAMAEKQSAEKDQSVTNSPTPAPAPNPAVPAAKKVEDLPESAAVKLPGVSTDERYFITTHLNGIVGTLTPAAEELMGQIISKHGMFKFTMAMMKAQEHFKPDLGLILMKEIDSKIGESL